MVIVNNKHITVNAINVTVSAMSICPYTNFENKFIKDKLAKISLKLGKNHDDIKNPIVIIPAIIWFSVRLDASIPNEI